ncbi:MAG: PilZ domain-containing protein [Chitinispirillaceae bacterium]|nr:PilZ domain-containing protein [Chitinispirillaceae bacterium]
MKYLFSLIPFTLPLCAAAVPTYSDLNLPRAGAGETAMLVVLCFALVGSFVLFELVRARREYYLEKNVIGKRFAENARRFSLDSEERRLLNVMAAECRISDVNDFFSTLTVFERAVEKTVENALGAHNDEERLLALEELLQSLRKKMHYGILEPGQPIISTRNLSPGQTVWILGPKKTVVGEAAIALVRELYFTVKLIGRDFSRMPAFESPVRMAFTRKADGIYGIEVPLVSFDPSAGSVKCRHTLSFKRNQLRQDVRVETDLMISIRCVASEKGRVTDAAPFMVKMSDLSGGGLAFVTERQLAAGDTILVTATTPRLTIAGVQARILAASRHRAAQHFLYHARFITIDFEKKEKIVKYVFSRMRELNQR